MPLDRRIRITDHETSGTIDKTLWAEKILSRETVEYEPGTILATNRAVNAFRIRYAQDIFDGFHASVLELHEDPAASTSETVVSITEIGRRKYLELQTGVP